MTIGKKLYWGFGAVLGLVTLVSLFTWSVMAYDSAAQHKMATLFDVQRSTAEVGFLMMQNHQNMGYYLLTGVPNGIDEVRKGQTDLESKVQALIINSPDEDLRRSFQNILETERKWHSDFVDPLAEKRKQMESGNVTMDQLSIYYMGLRPDEWLTRSRTPLVEAQTKIKKLADAQAATSQSAGYAVLLVSILGMLATIAGGLFVAFKISKQITEPLSNLI